jgi:hypothetical protein
MTIPSRLRLSATHPLVLLVAVLSTWLLAGGVAAPLLLPRLAPGSLPARLLTELQAGWWDGVVILLVFAAVVPALAALRLPRAAAWIPPATAEGIGAIRMWIASILLASVLWEDLPSSAWLPRGMLDLDRHWLVGTLHGLPVGFDAFLASPAALAVYESLTALLLALAAVGLFTRWTVPAAALAYLLFAAILRSYAWSYHTGLVPLYALLLLSFTPCGDGWSLDRWRLQRRGRPVVAAREPQLRYALARYLVWMSIALPYTMAGLSKIRKTGLLWWRGEHMKQMLVATVVEPMQFGFEVTYRMLIAPDWVWDGLGLIALAGEVTFVLVLVSRLARLVLPLLMAGMHVGILLMQNILFPDLIAIQAVFYDWTPVRERLAAWGRRARSTAPGVLVAPLSGDAPEVVEPTARRVALVARSFLGVAFLVWTTRTEKFPLSAMQMFSSPQRLGPVEYVRPLVVYADGTREPARFERWIGAVADSRYRRLIRWDRYPERGALLREFLDAAARRASASTPAGRRIDRFELEHRRWDFRRHPDDPERGEILGVLHHRSPRASDPVDGSVPFP